MKLHVKHVVLACKRRFCMQNVVLACETCHFGVRNVVLACKTSFWCAKHRFGVQNIVLMCEMSFFGAKCLFGVQHDRQLQSRWLMLLMKVTHYLLCLDRTLPSEHFFTSHYLTVENLENCTTNGYTGKHQNPYYWPFFLVFHPDIKVYTINVGWVSECEFV